MHARSWFHSSALILLWPGLAWAVTWCVPSAAIGGACHQVAATIQGAIDAGRLGDVIRVGPGNPPERIVITKRVRIVGVPGHLITDAGLPPSPDPLIRFSGTFSFPMLEGLDLDVVTSGAGIVMPSTITSSQFKGVHLTSAATPRPAYGLQVNGATRMHFVAGAGRSGRVTGFDVGIELNDVDWLDVEAGSVFEDNHTGLRVIHGKGQIFWNTFRNNGIGLESRGVFHMDTNSNDFIDNGIGVLWGLADTPHPETKLLFSRQTEFDHNEFVGNDDALLIEHQGCSGRWNNNSIDGDVQPSFKTPYC